MTGPTQLTEFARELLKAQGIDPHYVKAVTLDVAVDEMPTVTFTCYVKDVAAAFLLSAKAAEL